MTEKMDLLGRLELQVVRDSNTGVRKVVFRNQRGELLDPVLNPELMATFGAGGVTQADLSSALATKANASSLAAKVSTTDLTAAISAQHTVDNGIYAPVAHAARHAPGGADDLSEAFATPSQALASVGSNPLLATGADLWFDANVLTTGLYAYDTFARSDSPSLGTSSSGQVWTTSVGAISIISGNAVMASGVNAFTSLTTGVVDAAVDARIKMKASGTATSYLVPRWSNSSNFIAAKINASSGSSFVQVISNVAGTTTQVGIINNPSGLALGSTVQIRVEAKGNVYRVYVNGVLRLTTTDSGSNFLTSTQQGFGFDSSDTSSTVVNWFCSPLALGGALVDGDTICAWPDLAKPDSLQAAKQVTSANRPTYKTSQQNGLSAVLFDGTNSQIDTTAAPADLTSFTAVAVVNHTSAQTGTILGSATGGIQWRIDAAGTMSLNKTNAALIGTSVDTVPVNQWVVLAVTYDTAGNVCFFINGRPAGVANAATTFTAGTKVQIGGIAGSERFAGYIGEIARWSRALAGAELRASIYRMASKWAVILPARIAANTYAPLRFSGLIKGANIHPRSSDFGYGSGSGLVGLWGHWDWTGWIKPCVDGAKALGCNVIRIIGDVESVYTGVITQATYLAQLTQLADYLQSQGMYLYACGGDPTHFAGADNAFITSFLSTQATTLAPYARNVIAFDLVNEASGGWLAPATIPEQVLIGWIAQWSRAVRVALPTTPITVSNVSGGWSNSATPLALLSDWKRYRQIAPYVDFFDVHVYPQNPNTTQAWHGGVYEMFSDKPIVYGEFGASRASRTGLQMADAYETVRQMMLGSPQCAGAIQWAIVNDNYGLYNESAQTLQSDIAPTFAAFPTVR